MRLGIVIISVVFLMCCNSKYNSLTSGYFESTCYVQRYPGVILRLERDSSFEYTLAYADKKITGKWELHGDTLLLTSVFFAKKYQKEMMPRYKYTDYSVSEDAYLFKGNNLYIIDKSRNVAQECFLKHRKK